MKNFTIKVVALSTVLMSSLFVSCNDDDSNDVTKPVVEPKEVSIDLTKVDTQAKAFVSNYANIVAANYEDSYTGAVALQKAITAFIANPTKETQDKAKSAWLYARDFYGQTEAYREANGPVDAEGKSWAIGNEGQMNAWPLEESYIDYVAGTYSGAPLHTTFSVFNGLINDQKFVINEANIIAKNEAPLAGDDKEAAADNISTGWHAIEFLLWGQDRNQNAKGGTDFTVSGTRSYQDYVALTSAEQAQMIALKAIIDGKDEKAKNPGIAVAYRAFTRRVDAKRRADYLKVVTDLLVKDLKSLKETWATGGTYRKVFEALSTKEAITNILGGIGFISKGEVSNERLDPAIDEGQENEHSCFSDNTNQDMWANVHGLYNVIEGRYTRSNKTVVVGTSLIDLVKAGDKETAEALEATAEATIDKLNALLAVNKNFDEIINGETLKSNGVAGQLSSALKTQGDKIAEIAKILGLKISVE